MCLSRGEIVLAGSCCWERKEQCMRDAVCTCGEWLFDDAAGAGKNNAYWMQGGHSRRVAFGVTLRMRKEQCILDAESTCGKWLLMAHWYDLENVILIVFCRGRRGTIDALWMREE